MSKRSGAEIIKVASTRTEVVLTLLLDDLPAVDAVEEVTDAAAFGAGTGVDVPLAAGDAPFASLSKSLPCASIICCSFRDRY